MGLIATNSGGGEPTSIPTGTHVAICCQVIDIGTQYSDFYKKSKYKVVIGWELPNIKNEKGEPHLLWERYTLSLHENARLRQHLESWRGKSFTQTELDGFNLKNVLDKPCMISVTHSEDKQYANVQSVMGLPKGTPIPTRHHSLLLFDIDTFDQIIFDTFSDNLKKTIENSEERKKFHESLGSAEADAVAASVPNDNAPVDESSIPF